MSEINDAPKTDGETVRAVPVELLNRRTATDELQEEVSPEITTGIHDYVDVVYRKKWIIVLTFVSVFLATLYFVRKRPEKYMSTTTVYMEPTAQNPSDPLKALTRSSGGLRDLAYYSGIFASRNFNQTVKDRSRTSLMEHGFGPRQADESWKGLHSLKFVQTEHERFMNINAVALEPLVAYVVDSVAQSEFRRAAQRFAQEESDTTLTFIEQQLASVQAGLSTAEETLQRFRQMRGILLTNEKAASRLPNEYRRLQESVQTVQRDKVQTETELQSLEGVLAALEQDSKRDYRIAVTAAKGRERASVLDKIRVASNQLELLGLQQKSYISNLKTYESENPGLFSIATEHVRLTHARDVQQSILDMLLERREEVRIQAASTTGGIKIIDTPTYSHFPVPTQTRLIVILGAAFGLFIGVAIAFTLDHMDTSLKSEADVNHYLGLSLAGTVPTISSRSSASVAQANGGGSELLVSRGNPKSPIAEAYRALRTNLVYAGIDDTPRAIVVSSAGQAEGKSITSANLAITLAQMGHRTLLIDADLRRPVQHKLFDMDQEHGLSELLVHNRNLVETAKPTLVENLSLLTAGVAPPNPAPLLASEHMAGILATAQNEFDIVLVDSPPVIAVTDAVLLGRMTDGLLLVTRCASTPRGAATHAIGLLRGASVRIFGVLLNDVDVTRHYGGYGYYYYYYHYYYGGHYGSSSSS